MKLSGMPAIVSGGASGLGAATAERLAAAGARVAILDMNDSLAAQVAGRIGGIAVHCDVADAASAERAIAEARVAHGSARILVHCAGIATAQRIVGRDGPMPLESFERTVRVNL